MSHGGRVRRGGAGKRTRCAGFQRRPRYSQRSPPARPARATRRSARRRRARGRDARTPDPAQTSGARALAGAGLLASPCVPSPVSAIRTPKLPLLPVWGWRMLHRGRFLGSPCVPSSVSGISIPKLPLLPVWEKGAGEMRGKSALECRKPACSREEIEGILANRSSGHPHAVTGAVRHPAVNACRCQL